MSDIAERLREIVREEVRAELTRVLNEAKGDTFLSTTAAAEFASVTEGTIRRWVRTGKLANHRAGRSIRVLRTDLENLLRDTARAANDESPEVRAARDFG